MRVAIMGSQARSMANFWPTLIRLLVHAGHEVFCLVPETSENADERAAARMRSWGAQVQTLPLDRRGLNPLRDAATLYHTYKTLKKLRPDVFFGYAIKPVIYGTIAARIAAVPGRYAMITGLGYTFEADSLPKKLLTFAASRLYRFALGHCGGVFFQNQDDLAHFRKLNILPATASAPQIKMLRGTGVDVEHFAMAPSRLKPPTFLLVGRVIEAKGIREFAEAAAILKARYPEARFQILGPAESGPGSVPQSELAAWQGAGIVEYLGATDDVRPYIAAAGVMVLPSYREGLPTSIMEGMSMGRPAVVADAPGSRDLVRDGVNGFLVPVRNAVALAAGMERFILDPGLIESMGKTARGLAESEYDARRVAASLIAYLGLVKTS